MKRFINNLVDRFPFAPLFLFAGGGLGTFASIYFVCAPWPLYATVFGLVLLALFVLFLILCRSGDRAAIGTAGPAIIGPALTHLYVKFRAPQLEPILNNGGDLLIQLSFFFASLFGAAVYIFLMLGEKEGHHREKKARVCFVLFATVCCVIILFDVTGQAGFPGKPIAFDIEAPRLTALTIARLLLALISIVVAVWPKPVTEMTKA